MNLEGILLKERSQPQKATQCMVPLIYKTSRLGDL